MHATLPSSGEAILKAVALTRHPRSKRLLGERGGTARYCVCYICDTTIATWCGSYPRTKTANRAIEAHMNNHLDHFFVKDHKTKIEKIILTW
ncbi:MAG: hypothetical protein ACREHG_03700 [Candidatus Saccharimonadales bacterium]